jgi:hypothetical protein
LECGENRRFYLFLSRSRLKKKLKAAILAALQKALGNARRVDIYAVTKALG